MARQHFPLCLTRVHYVLLISCAPPKVHLTFWNALSVDLCTFDFKFKPDFLRRGHLIQKCLVVWKLQYVFEWLYYKLEASKDCEEVGEHRWEGRKLVGVGGKEGSGWVWVGRKEVGGYKWEGRKWVSMGGKEGRGWV